jgi:hypothetical protein
MPPPPWALFQTSAMPWRRIWEGWARSSQQGQVFLHRTERQEDLLRGYPASLSEGVGGGAQLEWGPSRRLSAPIRNLISAPLASSVLWHCDHWTVLPSHPCQPCNREEHLNILAPSSESLHSCSLCLKSFPNLAWPILVRPIPNPYISFSTSQDPCIFWSMYHHSVRIDQ